MTDEALIQDGTGSQAVADPLQELARHLSGVNIEWGPGWITFNTEDAFIVGTHQEGSTALRIRAYLGQSKEGEVEAWVVQQRQPRSGLLRIVDDEGVVQPRLVFERPVAGNDWPSDLLREEIREYSIAWGNDEEADPARCKGSFAIRDDPRDMVPSSAWLLLGDDSSFPDTDELAAARASGDVGIFDYVWTAAKQTVVGDLVLIYFLGGRKAAHFVARASSNAFFTDDIDVNARTSVARQQWWVYLTPPTEIDPITFATLQAGSHGHLILRGRSGKFLHPKTIELLTVRAKDPSVQGEVDRLWKTPSGIADLPRPENIDMAAWASLAAGALPLEAHVSSHIVEPLLTHALGEGSLTWKREHPAGKGSVDFVVLDEDRPVCAIEVKLAIYSPPGGSWAGSKDMRQLRRYMNDLGVPGILVDANRVLLVELDEGSTPRDIVRRVVTPEDIETIRRHLTSAGASAGPARP